MPLGHQSIESYCLHREADNDFVCSPADCVPNGRPIDDFDGYRLHGSGGKALPNVAQQNAQFHSAVTQFLAEHQLWRINIAKDGFCLLNAFIECLWPEDVTRPTLDELKYAVYAYVEHDDGAMDDLQICCSSTDGLPVTREVALGKLYYYLRYGIFKRHYQFAAVLSPSICREDSLSPPEFF